MPKLETAKKIHKNLFTTLPLLVISRPRPKKRLKQLTQLPKPFWYGKVKSSTSVVPKRAQRPNRYAIMLVTSGRQVPQAVLAEVHSLTR